MGEEEFLRIIHFAFATMADSKKVCALVGGRHTSSRLSCSRGKLIGCIIHMNQMWRAPPGSEIYINLHSERIRPARPVHASRLYDYWVGETDFSGFRLNNLHYYITTCTHDVPPESVIIYVHISPMENDARWLC